MEIDPAKQAADLAEIFFNLSNAVDDYRLANYATLSPAQQQRFKEQAQALDNRGQHYTAESLAAIKDEIQPYLANIKLATKSAHDALTNLNDIAKAIKIVDAAVALVGSIATHDIASIGNNVQGLLGVI